RSSFPSPIQNTGAFRPVDSIHLLKLDWVSSSPPTTGVASVKRSESQAIARASNASLQFSSFHDAGLELGNGTSQSQTASTLWSDGSLNCEGSAEPTNLKAIRSGGCL